MTSFKSKMSGLLQTFAVAALLMAGSPAYAQLTTGTVRGTVEGAGAGVRVLAVNPETAFSRSVETREDGSYVLPGLRPGTYRITAVAPGRTFEEVVRLQVAQTLVVDLTGPPEAQLASIEVFGISPGIELRTSEIGTNVTTEQIESLPQSSRNFLNFAQLAPGVRISRDEFRQQFSGGATNAEGDSLSAGQTNVFIDGVSLKSNIQQGGLVGQDSSRGNPFSQLAVQEFKVLTQNFKAEFEQAGSSIITAVTKSGSNEFEADAFGLFARKAFTEKNFFDKRDNRPKPEFTRDQFGASLGGPIIQDKLFFFASYEANFQDRVNTVVPGVPTSEQLADLGFDPAQFAGSKTSPFREHLGFGKLTWDISDRQAAEMSVNFRRETDIRDFGGQNALERANNIRNPVTTVRGQHQYFGDRFLNELSFDFRKSTFNPSPLESNQPALNFRNVINLGGQPFEQDVAETLYTLRDNITFSDFSWHGNHVVKTGVRVAVLKADVQFGAFVNPQFVFQDEPSQNLNFSFPAEANLGIGDPNINATNTQLGLFLQDDWEVTDKLTLNLGVRWDWEGNANNNDFETPQDIVDTLRALEQVRAADAAAGLAEGLQPTPDSFAFSADDFISTGSNRDTYKKMIQPRLGLSYDLFGDQGTVLFAGWGRAFDRTLFRVAAEEGVLSSFQQRQFRFSLDGSDRFGQPTIPVDQLPSLTREGLLALVDSARDPGREIRVVNNNLKPPRSDQFSLGVRQRIDLFDIPFQTSFTYSHIRTKDDIAFFPSNRSLFDRDNNGVLDFIPTPRDFGNFGNVITGINGKKTRFNGLFMTLDKPYTRESGWGFNIAYTLAFAKQQGRTFNFDFINPVEAPFLPNAANERHRIVVSGIVDLPYGFKLSTLSTFASGQPFTVIDLSNGFGRNVTVDNSGDQPGLFGFKQVDLRLQKDFDTKLGGREQTLSIFAEAINVFDTVNIGAREGFIPFEGIEFNSAFGDARGLSGPPRIIQFGARVSF